MLMLSSHLSLVQRPSASRRSVAAPLSSRLPYAWRAAACGCISLLLPLSFLSAGVASTCDSLHYNTSIRQQVNWTYLRTRLTLSPLLALCLSHPLELKCLDMLRKRVARPFYRDLAGAEHRL